MNSSFFVEHYILQLGMNIRQRHSSNWN